MVRLREEAKKEDLEEALVKGCEHGSTIKAVLSSFLPHGPSLAEHCILDANLDPNTKLQPSSSAADLSAAILPSLRRLEGWFMALEESPPPGFITQSTTGSKKSLGQGKQQQQQQQQQDAAQGDGQMEPQLGDVEVYVDFNPIKLHQSSKMKFKEFETFDKAVDEFFSKVVSYAPA